MNLKSKKGITLVALVVTIIVLLILAGVSLSLIAGSDGILGKANNATVQTQKAGGKEEAELFLAEMKAEYYSDKYVEKSNNDYNTSSLQQYLKSREDTITGKIKSEQGGEFEFTTKPEGETWEFKYVSSKRIEVNGKIYPDDKVEVGETKIGSVPGGTTKYTITYNANGGTGAPTDTTEYTKGTEVTLSTEKPTYAGHTFLGWAESATASESDVIKKYTIQGNKEFYAVWMEGYRAYTKESSITFGGYDFYIIGGETSESENLILLLQTTYGSNANWETAKSNATAFGTSLEVTGRLMTKDEANSISSGISKIGSSYWLGTPYNSGESYYWFGSGVGNGGSSNASVSNSLGVRPVIEVSKTLLP